MKRTVLLLLSVCVCVFVLSGCQGYREIDSEYLVSAIGFDKSDKKFKVYCEVLAIATDERDSESKVFSASGSTPYEAVGRINALMPKTAVFDHCGTALISENLEGKDLKTVFDYLYDTKNLNLGIHLFVCEDIKDLLSCDSQAHSVGYDIMSVGTNIQKTTGISFKNKFYEIESRIISTGGFCVPQAQSVSDRPAIKGQMVFANYEPVITLDGNDAEIYNILFSGSSGGAISVSGERCRVNRITSDLEVKNGTLLVKIRCVYRHSEDSKSEEIRGEIESLINNFSGTKALIPLGIKNDIKALNVEVN